MNSPRTTLYRDKANAKLMGVCSGIADYTGVDAFWVRLGFLGLTFITGGSTIPFYFLAGILLNKKPAHLYSEPDEQRYHADDPARWLRRAIEVAAPAAV